MILIRARGARPQIPRKLKVMIDEERRGLVSYSNYPSYHEPSLLHRY
jgi:hypothetical protein